MKAVFSAGLLLVAIAIVTPTLSAQWPRYPTPGIPRTAGKPDLTAPAPRTPDGKPDLSGIWEMGPGIVGGGQKPAAPPAAPPPPSAGAPAKGAPSFAVNFNSRGIKLNAGSGLKEGRLPYTPWALDLVTKRIASESKDLPDSRCLPVGNLSLLAHPLPKQIVQTPTVIVMISEANYGLRTIYMDGRPLPPDGEPQPWWWGYSIGRWEGDTLVVETNNFRDGGWLDVIGSPLTDQARTTERFRRTSFGTMEIEYTVNDPKAYTRPWTVTLSQRLLPDSSLIEFICNENEKSTHLFDR